MYLIDYHIHTNNSFDSKTIMKELCEAAIEKGLGEICITDHFSVKEGLPSNGYLNFEKYSNEVSECRELYGHKLKIKMGLEVCEPYENDVELGKIINMIPFDFVLGSVHNFDYNVGLSAFMSTHNKDESYRRYFNEVNKVCQSPYIDVVAHLDLMKRYAFNTHGLYDFNKYKQIIEEVLRNIINSGKGIEVNTSTLRSKVNEFMPSIDILKLYYELGGKIITVGSDCHNVEDLAKGIELAITTLKEIGFREIYTFSNRKAIAIPI